MDGSLPHHSSVLDAEHVRPAAGGGVAHRPLPHPVVAVDEAAPSATGSSQLCVSQGSPVTPDVQAAVPAMCMLVAGTYEQCGGT